MAFEEAVQAMTTPTTSNSRNPWRGVAIVIAALACVPAVAQEGPPPALVVTAPVVAESITETVELPGTVRPIRDSLVASEVAGRVASRAVENGDRVSKGQVLIRLDATRLLKDLDRVRAELDDVEAQLELALIQERRALDLYDQEILSQGEMDEAVARRQSLEGRASATEARIASIEDDIARTRIRAPFAGVVTEVHTEVGEWIETGGRVIRLADLGTVEIRLEVPESYYVRLTVGTVAPAVVDALPDLPLDGTIFAVVPHADRDARTFPVVVRAANPDGRVGAGMLVRVTLTLTGGEEALLIPKDAVLRQAQHEIVFVAEGETVRAVTVRTGRAMGSRVEVEGDLAAGDSVVVRGNERLSPGQRIAVGSADGAPASSAEE
jgi:RND family efflux transporter MFP subunit